MLNYDDFKDIIRCKDILYMIIHFILYIIFHTLYIISYNMTTLVSSSVIKDQAVIFS